MELLINGKAVQAQADPAMPLLWVLRDVLGMTGTKFGCGVAACGACTVRVDGVIAKSCLRLAVAEQGAAVQTLEGLGAEGALTPLQSAFWDNNAFQCGYCLSGMLFAAEDLLERLPSPTEGEIREAISGNLCRCTGYDAIVDAIASCAVTRPAG